MIIMYHPRLLLLFTPQGSGVLQRISDNATASNDPTFRATVFVSKFT
jgi:hypothetical protein